MSNLPESARKTVYLYTSKTLEKAAVRYNQVSGKPLPPRLVEFLCVFVTETVDFVWDTAEHPEKLSARSIAIVCIKRANVAVKLVADDSDVDIQQLVDCGVAAVSLALTISDVAELEAPLIEAITAATAATGGTAGAAYAAPLAIAVMGALYALYQAYEAIEACAPLLETPEGQDIPKTIESAFPAEDEVPEIRAYCIEQAQDLVCSPDHPDSEDDAASSSG